MIRATHGIIQSQATTDPLVQNFINTALLVDPDHINYVTYIVENLRSNNLLTKVLIFYPIVGGNANAHSLNLINVSTFQLLYSSAWTHTASGMQSNGSQYADTQFKQSDHLVLGDSSLGIYFQNNLTNAGLQGTFQNANRHFGMFPRLGNHLYPYINNSGADLPLENPTSEGLHLISRVATTQVLRKLRNEAVSPILDNAVALSTANFWLGGSNNGSGLSFPDTRIISCCFIGEGLNSSEMDTIEGIINAAQTILSRNKY